MRTIKSRTVNNTQIAHDSDRGSDALIRAEKAIVGDSKQATIQIIYKIYY